jgi:hypothetical protein
MVCPTVQECPYMVKIVLLQDLKGVDILPGIYNVKVEILLRGHVLRGNEVHDTPDDIHFVIVEQDIRFLFDDTREDPSVSEPTRSFGIEFHRVIEFDPRIDETILNFLSLIVLEGVVDNFDTMYRRQMVHDFIRDTSVSSPLITMCAHKENLHTPNKAPLVLKLLPF